MRAVYNLRDQIERDTAANKRNRVSDETIRELEKLRLENECLRETAHRDQQSQESEPREFYQRRQRDELYIDASAIPKVSFREATESVPHFDGYNIPLAQFIKACRRAKEIVPPSCERNITKLLINKLRGRAYYAVDDEECENVTHLIDHLTAAFESRKTINQYRGELSNIYLKPREHILDYISRVKDLRSIILDTERREVGSISSRMEAEIDELTAKSFCDGLPLEYHSHMGNKSYYSPFEAFSAARVVAQRIELDKQRYGNDSRFETEKFGSERSQRTGT